MGLTLDRWSPEPLYANPGVYAGTAVRALLSQMRHHSGVIDFAATLSAEVTRSPDHDLFDLLPTSRSSIGYRYDWTTYVIHPERLLHPGVQRPVASVPAGVRATGHDAETCPLPPEVLPTVLPERMG